MITISRSSTLYRFIITYYNEHDIPFDLCELAALFAKCLAWAVLLWALATCFVFFNVVFILASIFCDLSVWENSSLGIASLAVFIVTLAFMGIFAFVALIEKANQWRRHIAAYRTGLIQEYYNSIKGKYCARIKFE